MPLYLNYNFISSNEIDYNYLYFVIELPNKVTL